MKTRLSIAEFNKQKPAFVWLTLIEYIEETIEFGKTRRSAGRFKCKCGKLVILPLTYIVTGRQKSCNCMWFDPTKNRKYNSYNPNLRRIYYSMISRCHNPNDAGYKYYGGRGVRVCAEWRKDGQKFYDWAINNGWQHGLQLDKDKLGNGKLYGPKTCCFLTKIENMNAIRTNKRYDFMGEMLSVREISNKTGLGAEMIRARIEGLKWPVEKAATQKRRDINPIYLKN